MTDGEQDDTGREDGSLEVSRRQLVFGGGATLAAVGGGRAAYNTVLGYGHFGMGTNLREQDLAPLVTERLSTSYDERIEDVRVRLVDGDILVGSEESEQLPLGDDSEAAVALDRELGLGDRLGALHADLSALQSDEYTFEFHQPEVFFDRVGNAETRPDLVTAIRRTRDRAVEPDAVEAFTDADPTDTAAVVRGLVDGFRENTNYDIPRYVAGSVEDNVLFGARDLRQHFEDDVDLESLIEADGTGIFCWELVFRSIEALQAVPTIEQSIPVACCYVSDRRHKHAYTGVISAIREDGELVLPMTFLDYTYSTLYDDLHATSLLGEGLAAYDSSHRADEVYFW